MGRAGPACRGHQATTTWQHEQPGPQLLHLWVLNALSNPAGPTTGPPSPQRDQPGPGRARAKFSGLCRARHSPDHIPTTSSMVMPQKGRRLHRASSLLRLSQTGPTQAQPRPPQALREATQAWSWSGSTTGPRRRPPAARLLPSPLLLWAIPASTRAVAAAQELRRGATPRADPAVTVRAAPRSVATPLLGPAQQAPAHPTPVQVFRGPAQEVDPLPKSVPTPTKSLNKQYLTELKIDIRMDIIVWFE
ncbi:hypothetical protein NDU88_002435 [Pleurodeles waltl]|uniref:Uncharacterized protein n=1 Tax=Pleurodeles waltl TaxID=8319 RepID=A0AAV7TN37_PLEWA|nr:hypothetical protein NDU88_002435 [Pleurodeles waltl]